LVRFGIASGASLESRPDGRPKLAHALEFARVRELRARSVRRMHSVTVDARAALRVEPLREPQLSALASLLATTFDVDAGYRYLFPDAHERPAGLERFFMGNLQVHLPHGCTRVVLGARGALEATVTLRPPGGIPISKLTMVRRGLLPFALKHGRAAVKRLFWLKHTYDRLEQEAARGAPHWYVHMMAVRRDLQGRGLGGALLERVLEEAQRGAAHPIVLTTHSPQNVVFYRRARFELCDERELQPPGDRPYTVWSMRREP
jgi:ribosomal protein S18 acetylase RimI-like enzyme